ncbi:hypothetical protein SAMN05421505_104277 [Sinosporangium album]|uniref:Uncharacterized protein n=1 Tax=Sinosporangium album TaxID=504805 RepID=A0A1G7UJZ8_9ACTN|nr:hypothetical protein [Sinosporangium album]SDG47419.1 hypothetical protein SAMN05421505_104277 [Sinosporangium album]
MNTMTALLVDGAFLLVDGALTPQQNRDVVNSVLLARLVAAQAAAGDAGSYVNAFLQVLGNVGWTGTDITKRTTQLDGAKGPKGVGLAPLTIITQGMTEHVSSDLINRLVAEVSSLEQASSAVRQAWATTANRPQAQACLLIVATLVDGVPMLVYDYAELTSVKQATGYPWSPLTGPGTLTQFSGVVAMNRTVFTADFSAALANKVTPTRSAAVIPLHP